MSEHVEITPALLHKLLRYDSERGLLFWKHRPVHMFPAERYAKIWNTKNAGKEAFTALSRGYKHGTIFGQKFTAHRIAWAMQIGQWPDGHIDHINQNRTDNRIANLRVVTHQDNSKNQSLRSTNKSGVNGVSWYKRDSKWQAFIEVDGKSKCLGRFVNIEDAIAARAEADRLHGFHANHGSAK